MTQSDPGQAMTELDDRVVRRVYATVNPRPDTALTILYMDAGDAQFSVFAVSALLRNLRSPVLRTRPLRASDIALPNEANQDQEQSSVANRGRIAAARMALGNVAADCSGFIAAFPATDAAILAGIDILTANVADLLASAAAFGVKQTTWGFLYESRRVAFTGIPDAIRSLVARWQKSLAEFDARLAEYDALPPATMDEIRFDVSMSFYRRLAGFLREKPATSPLRHPPRYVNL